MQDNVDQVRQCAALDQEHIVEYPVPQSGPCLRRHRVPEESSKARHASYIHEACSVA